MGGGSGTITAGSGYAVGNSTLTRGILVQSSAIVDAGGGSIIMNGKGYAAGSGNGVYVNGGTVKTTNAGTINIVGVGGAGVNNQYGIQLSSNGSILGVNGDVSLYGTAGGSGGGSVNVGIWFDTSASIVTTTGTGNIAAYGVGGPGGSCHGILVQGTGGIKTTGGGNITLASVPGTGSTYGMNIGNAGAAAPVTTTGSGNITLLSNAIYFNTNAVSAAGTLIIAPFTASTTMGVGTSAAGTLIIGNSLFATALSAASYQFGISSALAVGAGGASAGATGLVTVNTATNFADKNVTFASGADISLAGNLSKTSGTGTATYLFQANGNIYNSSSAGISATAGAINLAFDSDYDQATVLGGSIYFTGGTINTNGGTLTMGGGTNPLTARATGTSTTKSGIALTSVTVSTGNGDISMLGAGYASAGNSGAHGVDIAGG
jgi:hypothetical protein